MDAYLDLARNGKNDGWRFAAAAVGIIFLWQVVGAAAVIYLIGPEALVAPEAVAERRPILLFVTLMLPSLLLVLGIGLAVHLVHRRSLLSLVTPAGSLSLRRLAQGFLVWLAICAAASLLEALTHPGRYALTLELPRFVPFALLALVLVPIQSSAEELLFRGYLLQGFGLRLRSIWVLSLLSGLIFGLPHLFNPEAGVHFWWMGLYYVSIGAALAFITLRDGRLELALGMHAANNLFTALFANYSGSVLPTPAVFTARSVDPPFAFLTLLAGLLLFVLVFFGGRRALAKLSAG